MRSPMDWSTVAAACVLVLTGCARSIGAEECEEMFGGVYDAQCDDGTRPASLTGVYRPGGHGWTAGCGYRSDLPWAPLDLFLDSETTMHSAGDVGVCPGPVVLVRVDGEEAP